jgi:dsRNA-specific ribonuclease
MDILNAVLAAIMLVIVTNTIRSWIRAIKQAREEEQKKRRRMKYYRFKK